MRWEVSPGVAFVANGARGVRAPNVSDLAALGARAGGRFQVPNPELRAEHTWSGDAGVKVGLGGVRIDSFVFALRYDDAITLVPTTVDGQARTPEGARYVQSRNAAHVDVMGTEGDITVPITDRAGVYIRWLALLGTQTNDPKTGLPVQTPADRMPPLQGTAGAFLTVTPSLRLELFVHGRARQLRLNDPINLQDNRIPEGGTPAFTTVHARVSYRPAEWLTLRVAADNIGDAPVLEHGSGFYRPGFAMTGGLEVRAGR